MIQMSTYWHVEQIGLKVQKTAKTQKTWNLQLCFVIQKKKTLIDFSFRCQV